MDRVRVRVKFSVIFIVRVNLRFSLWLELGLG